MAEKNSTLKTCVFSMALGVTSFFSSEAFSQQIQFLRDESNDEILFHYKWLDSKSQEQSLSLSFNRKGFHNHLRQFEPYNKDKAKKHKDIAIHQKTRELAQKHNLSLYYHNHKLVFPKRLASERQLEIAAELTQKLESWEQNYLSSHYQQLGENHFGQKGIMPDFAALHKKHRELFAPLKSVLEEKLKALSQRKKIHFLLNMVQNIPYADLERDHRAGFLIANQVLYQNSGDCDSKVGLLAALIAALYPGLEQAIILLENHAILGVSLPFRQGEDKAKLGSRHYLLLDPTGPRLTGFADVAESYKQQINAKMYAWQKF